MAGDEVEEAPCAEFGVPEFDLPGTSGTVEKPRGGLEGAGCEMVVLLDGGAGGGTSPFGLVKGGGNFLGIGLSLTLLPLAVRRSGGGGGGTRRGGDFAVAGTGLWGRLGMSSIKFISERISVENLSEELRTLEESASSSSNNDPEPS